MNPQKEEICPKRSDDVLEMEYRRRPALLMKKLSEPNNQKEVGVKKLLKLKRPEGSNNEKGDSENCDKENKKDKTNEENSKESSQKKDNKTNLRTPINFIEKNKIEITKRRIKSLDKISSANPKEKVLKFRF